MKLINNGKVRFVIKVFSLLIIGLIMISIFRFSSTKCLSNPSNYKNNKQSSNIEEKDSKQSLQNVDTEYKLFYGDWKVKKIVGKNTAMPIEDEIASEIIGKTITYSRDIIKNNGFAKVKNPNYNFAIIPITSNKVYIEKMPSLKKLGIEGKYFVYVYVYGEDIMQDIMGTEFYIKDDNTLIMLYNEVYYELKRISHIEDADIEQIHP